MTEKEVGGSLLSFLIRAQILLDQCPTLMTSFNLNYLLKTKYSHTGQRFTIWIWWGEYSLVQGRLSCDPGLGSRCIPSLDHMISLDIVMWHKPCMWAPIWRIWGNFWEKEAFKKCYGSSVVAQWLRKRLPMRGTQVQALVQEDPTGCGATKPVCHNYWACALEPSSHNYWARAPQLLKPTHLEPVLCNEKTPQWEARTPQQRVATARRN